MAGRYGRGAKSIGGIAMLRSSAEYHSHDRSAGIRRKFLGAASRIALTVLLCGVSGAEPARAEFTLKAAQVMARILSFMDHPPPAQVHLGLVYDPGTPASQKQAEAMMGQFGGGYKAGNFTFVPRLVKLSDAAGANVSVIVLMEGVGGASKIADITKTKKTPCFTSDISQFTSGTCLVGITTVPRVEVMLNRNLAAASGISFGSAFHMMITEM
jgi:hypothetical protein